jgi:hypothetical protein
MVSYKRPTKLSFAIAKLMATGLSVTVILGPVLSQAGELTLYVDKKTNQVYTSPGRNRVKIGDFRQIDKGETDTGAAAQKVPPGGVNERIDALEQKVEEVQTDAKVAKEQNNVAEQLGQVIKGKWYEKLKIGGYTQFRLTDVFNKGDDPKGPSLAVANDGSVGDGRDFIIRRGRIKLDGDVSNHLYLYSQIDFAGNPVSGSDFALQARDLYGDVSFDAAKEHRVRLGLSKVPYGWSNLQSSQNRAAIERADATNSAVEGERDYGVYYMWAPAEKRELFKDLVKAGLKGSGDYGVVALGAYSGQGPNRFDKSFNLHYIAHFSYPFKLNSGQYVELGLSAYTGRFVPTTAEVEQNGKKFTPSAGFKSGLQDRRIGAHFIWYPQPFGLEAEWNVGDGPELSADGKSIGVGFLHGGYVQTNYKLDSSYGTVFPYARWQYYDGGRKFGANSPHERVNEFELGFEYLPWPEIELTAAFVHSFYRTNTSTFPYKPNIDADRVTVQAQWNY